MASVRQQYIKAAKALPPRLLSFFHKFPPPALRQGISSASSTPASPQTITIAENTSSSDPNAPTENIVSVEPPSSASASEYKNPFLPHKHPITGRWHNPVFSLRRQAELVKLAKQHGVEELLPYTVKGTEERTRRREEHGLRVKGTGVGQRVKGKEWERTLKGRLEKRRQAMLQMPGMIQQWKERGHGRGWKKWPK
ncbi:hypothetical protein B0A49_03865 [Cryomyces minteri]|uniref:Large ribosomal subunit protein mL59 domain-containing protein n=1 Tax=Cryomyces minteri TaxID=331657 RepID=A0A4U0XJP7_9PEZI|nr:hypothetical protein B0A49_03865 [Cryomyces minteri]